MQEVVEVPGLVADPQVVRLVADDVVEHHEVVDEDLVHPPYGLERVQVMLVTLVGDVGRLAGQETRRGMDPLPSRVEHRGHRRLREPVDLQVGVQRAQLSGDGDVPLRMTEADGRRDVERPLRSAQRPRPRAVLRRTHVGGHTVDEIAQQPVGQHRIASGLVVAAALDRDEHSTRHLGETDAVRVGNDAVLGPMGDEQGAADRAAHGFDLGAISQRRRGITCVHQRLAVGFVRPPDAVLDRLRRVPLTEDLTEEELDEVVVVAQPMVPVVLGPTVVHLEFFVERVGRSSLRLVRRLGLSVAQVRHGRREHRARR